MNVVIETNRLLLRTFTIDDAQLIYDLNNDPDVIRYTYDPITDLEHASEVLEKTILPQYALYNHGRWAVHIKPDNLEFIGWCGLKYRPERNEIDLGYRFKKSAWGKGYATEAAYACLKYGFEKLNIGKIIGPGSARKRRLIEGFGENRDAFYRGGTGGWPSGQEPMNSLIRLSAEKRLLAYSGHLTFPKHFVFQKMSLYLNYEIQRR